MLEAGLECVLSVELFEFHESIFGQSKNYLSFMRVFLDKVKQIFLFLGINAITQHPMVSGDHT